MNRYRPNADLDIRKLQRLAAQGDIDASDQLVVEDLRNGRLTYESAVGVMVVARGPILGWNLTWEYPGFLQLKPPPPWDKHAMLLATPWWEREGTSFSPLSIASADGGWQGGIRDLFTPNTGNLKVDTEHYREQLAGAIMALSFAGASMLQGDFDDELPPEQAWDMLSEGMSGA